MKEITYVIGDATSPIGKGNKLIIHCNNSIGGWGRGFVLALSKKWKQPEAKYREWFKSGENFKLGNIQPVKVESNIAVVNMIGQEGIAEVNGVPPIRYEAIRECLGKVAKLALNNNASVHAPRFGAVLAGGKWEMIEKIIKEELCLKDIVVTIYDLNEEERSKYDRN